MCSFVERCCPSTSNTAPLPFLSSGLALPLALLASISVSDMSQTDGGPACSDANHPAVIAGLRNRVGEQVTEIKKTDLKIDELTAEVGKLLIEKTDNLRDQTLAWQKSRDAMKEGEATQSEWS